MKKTFFETGLSTRGTTQIALSCHSGSDKPFTDNAVSRAALHLEQPTREP